MAGAKKRERRDAEREGNDDAGPRGAGSGDERRLRAVALGPREGLPIMRASEAQRVNSRATGGMKPAGAG
jgi:hypothetical protein